MFSWRKAQKVVVVNNERNLHCSFIPDTLSRIWYQISWCIWLTSCIYITRISDSNHYLSRLYGPNVLCDNGRWIHPRIGTVFSNTKTFIVSELSLIPFCISTQHRIPYSKSASSTTGRPIFLQHGFLDTDADWLISPVQSSLGKYISINGF